MYTPTASGQSKCIDRPTASGQKRIYTYRVRSIIFFVVWLTIIKPQKHYFFSKKNIRFFNLTVYQKLNIKLLYNNKYYKIKVF